jgi:hypothetical protein
MKNFALRQKLEELRVITRIFLKKPALSVADESSMTD